MESATRKLGSLPGEVDEKFKPWSIPLVEKCDELVGKQITEMLFESDYLKSIPVNFLRGSTFANNVVIVDEAQNLEHSELVTILTRFGKNCKLFVIGDSLQSDIQKSGLILIKVMRMASVHFISQKMTSHAASCSSSL